MIDSRTAPYAALVLRVTLGALFLAHASLKLFVFTPAGTAKFFGSLGFPPELAYLIMTVEVLSGIALILGVWTRYPAMPRSPAFRSCSEPSSLCTAPPASSSPIRRAAGNSPPSGRSRWPRKLCSATAPTRCGRHVMSRQRAGS